LDNLLPPPTLEPAVFCGPKPPAADPISGILGQSIYDWGMKRADFCDSIRQYTSTPFAYLQLVR
jgi:hypothetical protein